MSKIYIVSDLHIQHKNSLTWRTQFSSVEEMNQTIIDNWNKTVQPEDTVYNLGDEFLGDASSAQKILASLNGNKFLIRGNHSTKSDNWYHEAGFLAVFGKLVLRSPTRPHELTHILTHIPLPYWEIQSLEGYYGTTIHNWHGHLHDSQDRAFTGSDVWDHPEHYTNVCVELTNYIPIDFPL